jgi:uncharacterized protein YijF (DUF1287 family)
MVKKITFAIIFFSILNFVVAQHSFFDSLSNSAIQLTKHLVKYDPTYFKIAYPNGDVPSDKGV